ncbi:ABC transporter ATP-binding protein [bacterium]|nr:ABC transporter ATP-binding protein [bacterium]
MRQGLLKIFFLLNRPERRSLFFLVCAMIIGAVLDLFSLGIIPGFIALVADSSLRTKYSLIDSLLTSLGVQTQEQLLIVGSIIITITFFMKNAFLAWLYHARIKFTSGIQIRLTNKLLDLYYHAPYTFHLNRNTTDLFSRSSDQVRIVISNVLLPFLTLVMDFLFTFVTLGLVVVVEPVISLATFMLFLVSVVIYWYAIRKKAMKHGEELTFKRKEMYKRVFEGFGGLKEARVLNREQYFLDRSIDSFTRVTYATMYQNLITKLSKPFLETIAVSTILMIAIFITLQQRPLHSILTILALFTVASVKLMPNVNSMIANYAGVRSLMRAIEPIYEDITTIKVEMDLENEKDRKTQSFDQFLDIHNLVYQYAATLEPALKDINLTIEKGQAIGFIGPSGAGKSTLVDIILGLLMPTEGTVTVDGFNIFDNIKTWQRNIGYVPQQIFLSDNTIRSNIAFGIDPAEISDTLLWSAIRDAQLEELIDDLPDGVETLIGERGVRLSGGQRQRIGIARALYHNPQVLILDEATAALDNITERYIIEAIERLKGDRTIITVAHRLTTIKNCDMLFFLKNGQIIARGTFETLSEHSNAFKEMNS